MPMYRPLVIGCWLVLSLGACGGNGDPSRQGAPAGLDVVAGTSQSVGVRSPDGTARPGAQPAKQQLAAPDELRLSPLNSLPLLAQLTPQEKAALLRQLPDATPSRRFALINSYPRLASLPDLQKELLLNQLEKIVPLPAAQAMLVCECGAGIKRQVCISESCSGTAELASICNKECGTLAAFNNQCAISGKCQR